MDSVKVWHEKVVIPTYLPGKPDKNPVFLEKRVYQGSSGKVYPHPVIDSVSDEKTDYEYQAVWLENEYIKVMILPELGGRIQRALDKTNGYDFVYYNHVIKPALVGLAGPWISGGIEFNWPQHHRPSTFDPVLWKIDRHPSGSASVIVGEIETMFRTQGSTVVTLHPGKAYIELKTSLFNRTDAPQTFLWWANPAVAVNDDTQSIFPPDVSAVMDHGKRDVCAFPIAKGVYYKVDYSPGTDISRYRNIPVPTSYMAYHSDYDFVGNYDYGRGAGLLHVADHHISPGKKQWTWGCGAFGKAWDRNLTDEDGPYIELMTGCYTDNQPDFSWLMPYEAKTFTQYFMPYKGVGAVQNSTRDAAARVSWSDGMASVSVCATGIYKNTTINVTGGGQTLYNSMISLTPDAAWNDTFPTSAERLELTVSDSEGHILVRCDNHPHKEDSLPDPASVIPPAAEAATNEELFLFGQHIEQYRHATWAPSEYYLEGLRRDPADARINNAYGKLLVKQGLPEHALPYFKASIRKNALKNPNPYDGEPYFNLGAALDALGQETEAYDAFWKSTWNAAWQSAGLTRIGMIDLRRGDLPSALAHLGDAVAYNSRNRAARNANVIALRLSGRISQAASLANETLALDALDLLAASELDLLGGGSGEGWLGMPGLNPNMVIEVALEYARCGRRKEASAILSGYAVKSSETTTTSPMVYYHLAFITNDAPLLAVAEQSDFSACFPHRLEDRFALEWAINNNPKHAGAAYALGNLWYDKRQTERAVACWDDSANLNPAFPTVHRNLALAYYNKRGDKQAALREMELAFRLDETDSRVLMELDQLRKKLHTPTRERLEFLQAHWKQASKRDDLYLEACTLHNLLGQHEKALAMLISRKFHPWEGGEGKVPAQWRVAQTALARREIERGGPAEAIRRLLETAGDYPESFGEGKLFGAQENEVYCLLGFAYAAASDAESARTAWNKASEGLSNPTGMMYYNDQPPETIYYQGVALRMLGDEAGAKERFDKLVAYGHAHMDDSITIEYFAVSLPDLQIFDEDLTQKNRAHCLFMLALGLLGNGRRAEADEALSRLEAIEPEHSGLRTARDRGMPAESGSYAS